MFSLTLFYAMAGCCLRVGSFCFLQIIYRGKTNKPPKNLEVQCEKGIGTKLKLILIYCERKTLFI